MKEKSKVVAATQNTAVKESISDLIWEAVGCWLLTAGTALLLDAQFVYNSDIFAILVQTFCATAVLMIITRKWFIAPIAVVLSAGVGFILLYAKNIPISEAFNKAIEFIKWWAANMPEDSYMSTQKNLDLVQMFIRIGVSVLVFALIRLTRRVWPALIICFGAVAVVMGFGFSDNNSIVVAFYLAGAFLLMARDRYSGRKLFSRKIKFNAIGSRFSIAATACVLCIAVTLGLLQIMPEDTTDIRTRWCTERTADIQSFTGIYTANQKNLDKITLRSLGLQPYSSRIGGNFKKYKSDVLAVTNMDKEALLGITTYDTFTGTKWSNNFSAAYRLNANSAKRQNSLLSNNMIFRIDEEFAYTETVTITLTQPSHFLLTNGQTSNLIENTGTINPLLYNRNGEIFSFFEMPEGYSYTIKSRKLRLSKFDDDNFLLMSAFGDHEQDELYSEKYLAPYLALPDDYSEDAIAFAESKVKGIRSELQKASIIASSFSKNDGYRYTNKPGELSKDETVVDVVLNTKRGNCMYYATAAATMMRAVGIPSRLVAGYKTVKDEQLNTFVVDANSPYAWVECYMKGLGWIAFDPTPVTKAKQKKVVVKPKDESFKDADESEYPDDIGASKKPREKKHTFLKIILTICAILGALIFLLLLLALRGTWTKDMYDLEKVKRRYPQTSMQAEYYYQDIIKQLGYMGFKCKKGLTLQELIRIIEHQYFMSDEVKQNIFMTLEPVMAMHYGRDIPTEENVKALCELHSMLEDIAKTRRSPIIYHYFRRSVLLRRSKAALRWDDNNVKFNS